MTQRRIRALGITLATTTFIGAGMTLAGESRAASTCTTPTQNSVKGAAEPMRPGLTRFTFSGGFLCGTPTVTVTRYVRLEVESLAVRAAASTSSAQVGTLSAGTAVRGTITNGWLRLTSGSFDGKYISAGYLTTSKPVSYVGWVANLDHPVNVRSGPGTNYSVVGTRPAAARVVGTVSDNWVKTSTGYVSTGGLQTVSSDVKSSNGKLPASTLCNAPLAWNSTNTFAPGYKPTTQRYLNCVALEHLTKLQAAYKAKFGKFARIDLTYRTVEEQWFWFNKYGSPRAAVPGTSPHGYGVSVDFQEDDGVNEFSWGQAGNNWLRTNGRAYGFTNPFRYGTWGESYHFNFVG